jgi:hypothetical protein
MNIVSPPSLLECQLILRTTCKDCRKARKPRETLPHRSRRQRLARHACAPVRMLIDRTEKVGANSDIPLEFIVTNSDTI